MSCDATSQQPGVVVMIGETISHYKVLRRLGGGGMGDVFMAEDTRLKRKVALKFLPREWSDDPEARGRLMQEARATSKLDHPNICTVYDIAETDEGRVFIVMAFYEGVTLKCRIERGPLPTDEAVDIAIQIAEGLAKAHGLGIVHRDVKPANLIHTPDGLVKILDFGLAKLTGVTTITRESVLMGTPAYMSPEQARGDPVDHRSDIWTIGVVLYEMLAGRAPFRGGSMQAVLYSILSAEPEPLRLSEAHALPDLKRIVDKALAKFPEQRYQHVDDVLVDLRSVKDQLVTETSSRRMAASRPDRSIAVLPFANMSADLEQEYFCDGMAEEIINALMQVDGLHVVARTSAFAFKGKYADIRGIGNKLNVRTVLEGSVRKAGNRLRIAVKLIKVADGYQLWSETYDREMEDVFTIQDEISQAIVNTLKVKLAGDETTPLVKRHTDNLEAYTLYLKGRFHWNRRTEEDVQKGIKHFERAIVEDPEYALAYAGLADSYNILGYYGTLSPEQSLPRAKESARKALEIDEKLAEPHTSLAFATLLYDRDWTTAEAEFARAFELNPEYATAHHWFAEYLTFTGRHEEAIAEAKRALVNDPLALIINTLVGWVLYYARDYDRAIRKLRRTLELDSSFVPAYLWLGLSYGQQRRFEEAIAAFRRAMELSEESTLVLAALGAAHAAAGEPDAAGDVLVELEARSKRTYVPCYHLGAVYAALGDADGAFGRLEESFQRRDSWLVFLGVDPVWDGLRSDPRFADLTGRIGLRT